MRTLIQYCAGCSGECPVDELVNGLCPVCREEEPEPPPKFKPVGAGVHTRPRADLKVGPYEGNRVPTRPYPREVREREERVARDNLRGWRTRAAKERCPACGTKATLRRTSGLCRGCDARWCRRGSPVNPDGTPDLTNLFQSKRGALAKKEDR